MWDPGHGCFVRWAKQEAATAAAATAATAAAVAETEAEAAVDEDEAAAVAAATGARPVRYVRVVVQVPSRYHASHPIDTTRTVYFVPTTYRYGSMSDVVLCRYLPTYIPLFGPDGMRWHGMAWHGKGRGNSFRNRCGGNPAKPAHAFRFVLASVTLLELPAADKLQQVCLLLCASVRCSGRPTVSLSSSPAAFRPRPQLSLPVT